jgi:hypothetical protein
MVVEALAKLIKNGSVDMRRLSSGEAVCMLEINSGEVDECYVVTTESTSMERAISLAAYEWAMQEGR